MTREEKQKAINALKISAPIMAMTQEEFNDYIQTLNKIIDWLEQEPRDDWCDVPSDEMTLEQARQAVKDLRKKLVEHLEQEPTKNDLGVDCISRKAALDITWQDPSYSDLLNVLTEVRDKIRELPSVTPQEPRWIPVNERTPEHGGEYLLWGKICDDDDEEYCFLGDYYEFEEKFGIENGIYDPHTLGFLGTEIDEYYSVIAWMPLPESYKVETEADNG